MVIKDGTAATLAAARAFESQKQELRSPALRMWTRDEFVAHAARQRLTNREKRLIVDQAILIVEQFYAHLVFKRARYGVDPVQRLRLIRAQSSELEDLEFHAAMLRTMSSLRDAHTYYGLPSPWRNSMAFLPFRVQCTENSRGVRRYFVTRLDGVFSNELPEFINGAEIHAWNGVEIGRAVENQGEADSGANPAARLLRGLNRLTVRPLSFMLPPDESWVVVEYSLKGKPGERAGVLIPWIIGSDCIYKPYAIRSVMASLSEPIAETREIQRMIWARAACIAERKEVPPPVDPEVDSKFAKLLQFQHTAGTMRPDALDPAYLIDEPESGRRFGYIRIFNFILPDTSQQGIDAFVDEFERIVVRMNDHAPDGLIVDIRSNPGGVISAAERLLQFFTPQRVKPAGFHFASTNLTRYVATSVQDANRLRRETRAQEWEPWVSDLMQSIVNGDLVTQARQLTPDVNANLSGQKYQGPVALLIDATSYSAADIFAAGFQDHEAGTVIGVDASTGGGGANGLSHEGLREQLAGVPNVLLEPLPKRAQLGLALRRSSRVGRNAGAALEDVGVTADERYRRTADDLMHDNRDMFRFVCRFLAGKPKYRLVIHETKLTDGGVEVRFEARSLQRVEFALNGCVQAVVSPKDEDASMLVPNTGLVDKPDILHLRGYDGDLRLVVCTSASLSK